MATPAVPSSARPSRRRLALIVALGAELLRVDGGGPVIGLLPAATYQEFAIDLRPGDLLVGYTDGVSEAMNPDHEEWGEERMAEAVRTTCLGLPPKEVVERLMAAADGFAHGAKQHDDMTLVVIRVTLADPPAT